LTAPNVDATVGDGGLMNTFATIGAAVLFATVFDDCGNMSARTARPMTPVPPDKPCCLTDPPEGCRAYCAAVGDLEFSAECGSIAAGARTLDFQDKVSKEVTNLLAQGAPLCPDSLVDGMMQNLVVGDSVTPCALNLPPVEWPAQDHSVCMPMDPGLCVTSW
jgi:hypothetical protein